VSWRRRGTHWGPVHFHAALSPSCFVFDAWAMLVMWQLLDELVRAVSEGELEATGYSLGACGLLLAAVRDGVFVVRCFTCPHPEEGRGKEQGGLGPPFASLGWEGHVVLRSRVLQHVGVGARAKKMGDDGGREQSTLT